MHLASTIRDTRPARAPFPAHKLITVWLDDKRDADRALEILQIVEAEVRTPTCRACGYSLQGHAGGTICPECGAAQTASAADGDQECPACHEAVPAGFELCWNCGAGMTGR